MPILWEGGEEGAVSPETPLVGAFHVFQIQLRSRAVPMVASASSSPVVRLRPVRRPLFPCGAMRFAAYHIVPFRRQKQPVYFPSQEKETKGGFDVYPRPAAKNNPCIFLPEKKKQKATEKKTPHPCGVLWLSAKFDELYARLLAGERVYRRVALVQRHNRALSLGYRRFRWYSYGAL